jgi:hypothetical protein
LESEGQFRLAGPGSYYYSSNYFALGLDGKTDFETTLYGLSSPKSGNITIGAGFKTAFPLWAKQFAKEGFQLTVGEQALFSLQGEGTGGWAYSHLSGKVPQWGTRLTAGVSAGTKQLFGVNTVAFIGGVEQPVTPKLSVLSDWYSGANALGFLTAGFSYGISKIATTYIGYQFPNGSQSAGRQGFTAELSFQF